MKTGYKNVVLKFGGSVLKDETGIIQAANLIANLNQDYDIYAVVVSAMGKTTNNLEKLANKVAGTPRPRELDALLVTGEMQSAALLSMALRCENIAAQSYNAQQFGIKASDNFGYATIESINPPVAIYGEYAPIPIVAGFQRITKNGDFVTLGREGSDITAVAVANRLKADFVWFFKNEGGICDKDPNENPDAKLLDKISYQQMLDLLAQGRHQVLHKRSIELAEQYNLPLFVSDIRKHTNGTLISSDTRGNSR